ncbi:putative dihydroxyacetone kinase [Erysiphe necator]|uniref:Putative dihydroxyacetone kinase n=1 Tax=Uncinula necator TaxID=52586 RepID=A0A0B1P4Z4_UNCNE|nr:putative dihydroxyacetone kinase [Erysiphe necator]
MSSKHFITDATHLVDAALQALVMTNPSLAVDSENKIIYRLHTNNNATASQVSIVSGGGSGHEPSFGAFVGKGLLSAAVAGSIFASPSAQQIRIALMSRVDVRRGILVIIMNYTGDVLNFGMAVEKAKAAGLNVRLLVVGDDVGVGRRRLGRVGRRGIAGTVLVHKISGALAARDASLDEIYEVAKLTANNLVSIGASLAHVHIPGKVNFNQNAEMVLGPEEVEIGMGIHNEFGNSRLKTDLPELVKTMLSQLLDLEDLDRAFLKVDSKDIVLLINNLGGLSVLELYGITFEVLKQLKQVYNIKPIRIYAGTYMSSLDSPGFSISILNVVSLQNGSLSMLELLDDPAEATGWFAPVKKETWDMLSNPTTLCEIPIFYTNESKSSGLRCNPEMVKMRMIVALKRLTAAEPEVTRYDTIVGDGDCGIGLKRCAQALLNLLSSTTLSGDIVLDLNKIISVIEKSLDGTSGALYTIFLSSLACNLRDQSTNAGIEITPKIWAFALRISCKDLGNYTPARPGDRTLVDALYPFVETLAETGDLLKAAIAARKGAEETKGLKARLGRTVYVGGSGYEEVPDPGAWGLSEFLLGLAGESRDEKI